VHATIAPGTLNDNVVSVLVLWAEVDELFLLLLAGQIWMTEDKLPRWRETFRARRAHLISGRAMATSSDRSVRVQLESSVEKRWVFRA
jgi:hypothetical protein